MTSRTDQPKPTDAELAILHVLWKRGPSTVREVHETLSDSQSTRYTTSLKLMQIMTEKGLVTRDASSRSHVYQARRPKDHTQRQIVGNLLDQAFEGSAKSLIMQALCARKATPDELDEIRALLDSLEGGIQ